MKYRKFGRTGIETGEIGMGLEHLLNKDENVVIETIKAAVNGGATYFDCHPADDWPEGEISYGGYAKLGKALQYVDRDKLCLSYIAQSVYSMDDTIPRFESYLDALNTDHTDVFMIQFCDKIIDYERITSSGGLLDYAKKMKDEGKARYIGISTHSSAIAYAAIDNGLFDAIMYPVNPAFDVVTDEERYKTDDLGTLWDAAYEFNTESKGRDNAQPRKSVYTECERNNIALIAMKPFAGGFIFRVEGNAGFTPLNLISYALTQTGVSTVVPGCQNPKEIEEILTYYTCPDEAIDFSKAVLNSRWNIKGKCQYCNHCLPCPANINIAQVNRMIDNKTKSGYDNLEVKASVCEKCGDCEERCPFGVKVTEKMDLAVKLFE